MSSGKAVLAVRVLRRFGSVRRRISREPLPALAASLGNLPPTAAGHEPAARLSRAVDRTLRFGPDRPTCLMRALVLYSLLREQGDPAEGAHHQVQHEREHDQDGQPVPPARAGAGEEEGHRVADDQRGARHGEAERETRLSPSEAVAQMRIRVPVRANHEIHEEDIVAMLPGLLAAANVPATIVNTLESLLTDPQLEATGFWKEVEHPTEGPIRNMKVAATWSDTPVEPTRLAPRLNQHGAEILREAGFSFRTAVHAYSALDSYIYGFAMSDRALPFDSPEQIAELAHRTLPGQYKHADPHVYEYTDKYTE